MKFQKGKLCFELHDGRFWELFYTREDISDDAVDFYAVIIAEVKYGIGYPLFSGGIVPTREGESFSGGPVVTFRVATDDDLRELTSAWSTHHSISDWVESVKLFRQGVLLQSEVDRIVATVGQLA